MPQLVVFLLIVLCAQASFARQSCDWPFRTSITVTQNDFNGLTDYPVDLFLSSSNLHSQYQWSSNGADLRIYSDDDATPLPFTINNWDATSQGASVRVSFPTLDMGTRTIYVYYGNQNVSSASTSVTGLSFVDDKIKFHTRSNNGVNPDSYAEAMATFNLTPLMAAAILIISPWLPIETKARVVVVKTLSLIRKLVLRLSQEKKAIGGYATVPTLVMAAVYM